MVGNVIKKLTYSSYIKKNIMSQRKVLLSLQPTVTRSLLKHCFNFPIAHFNIHKFNEVLKIAIKMVKKALEHAHYKRKDEKKPGCSF